MPVAPRPAARPLSRFRGFFREMIVGFGRRFGMKLIDEETGKCLGRALVIPFGGKIHIVGLEAEHPITAGFINQRRLTYWKQELGFRAAPVPDFPREAGAQDAKVDDRVLNLVLTHQPAAAVARMLEWWQVEAGVDLGNVLIAYGGNPADFAEIDHPSKVLVDDARLKTKDHQREAQSYGGVFRGAAAWLTEAGEQFTHVYLAEYDHLPLVRDLNERQVAGLRKENADVLALRLSRVDETSHAHLLYHADDVEFGEFWKEMSCRKDPSAREVVLTMFGTGSFWTREAFLAVAALEEPFPVYMELFLATAAHHLGFRVRPYPAPEARAFIQHLGDLSDRLDKARGEGAWTIHPVKKMWTAG